MRAQLRSLLVVALAACTSDPKQSALATSMASTRFSDDAVVVQRVVNRSYTSALIDQFAAASARALRQAQDQERLKLLLTQFDPLWDSSGAVIPSAVAQYTRRVAAVPLAAAKQWASLSALDPRAAVFSVAALGGLWYDESFSEPAFQQLVASARRSP